ncbi:hypothetical protein [Methylocapsa aurea]|uniref:hypothetical protein n=1 Tax=Methylocapsa aurea TaxID=663610 RepID=UPI0012EBED19|nr:hypothetical protein [Methylocapsa aurea]
MSFAQMTRAAVFGEESLRRRAKGNSLGQVLRVVFIVALMAFAIGLAMLPRVGHAALAGADAFSSKADAGSH